VTVAALEPGAGLALEAAERERAPGAAEREEAVGPVAVEGVREQFTALNTQTDLTTCLPGMVWDTKHQKCLAKHSGIYPIPS
jgi:hypothetical protein